MKKKTNIFDFLIEALNAERTTKTGRINITVSVLSTAILITLIPAGVAEVIGNTILEAMGKEKIDFLPEWLTAILIIATVVLFFTCLYVVRDMEMKKQSYGRKSQD